jgi:hypothetical protein
MDFKNANKLTNRLKRILRLVEWSLNASNIELQTLQCPLLWQLYTCVMSKPNPKQSYLPLTHYDFNEIQDKMHYYKLQFNLLLWLYLNDKSTFELFLRDIKTLIYQHVQRI